MKILFLTRSLYYAGGQQRQLVLLAKGLRERGHDVAVASFYSGGPLEKELLDADVRIRALNKRGRWDLLGFLSRVIRIVREERPDVLHGYLLEPNLIATLLKPLFPAMKVAWGVRCSYLDPIDWLDKVSFKFNCLLSRFPDVIIVNSHAGRDYHVSVGYPAKAIVVIPNGIDTKRFRPDAKARDRIRSEWGLAGHEKIIGLVGRLDSMKDHPRFLKAAALLAKDRNDTRFVCVGDGPKEYQANLQALAANVGLGERVLWAGPREDMPAIYNALDIAVSSSYGEGLSNVIAEAMACGVPCVVTNVGDSAWLVGDTGEVIPPKDVTALRNAIEKLLDHRPHTPAQIRQGIVDRLSISNLVAKTEHTLGALFRS